MQLFASYFLTLVLLSTTFGLPLMERLKLHSRATSGGGLLEPLFDIFIDGIIGVSADNLQKVQGILTPAPPTCCDGEGASDMCRINAGTSKTGHKWMACYAEGEQPVTKKDIDAMKCIIDLHYRQDDRCIDIKGSHCATTYGLIGNLQRGQMSYLMGPYNISAVDSTTLQAAADSMEGIKIDYDKMTDAPIDLAVVSDTNDMLEVDIMFDGKQGDDC